MDRVCRTTTRLCDGYPRIVCLSRTDPKLRLCNAPSALTVDVPGSSLRANTPLTGQTKAQQHRSVQTCTSPKLPFPRRAEKLAVSPHSSPASSAWSIFRTVFLGAFVLIRSLYSGPPFPRPDVACPSASPLSCAGSSPYNGSSS